jgi:anti-sigma B factor antagonist
VELAPFRSAADDVVRARIDDELDAATAPRVGRFLSRVVLPGSRVVLDMSGVPFLDCAGLAQLLLAHRRALTGGGWMQLTGVREGPRLVLELTGTAEQLTRPRIPGQRSRWS